MLTLVIKEACLEALGVEDAWKIEAQVIGPGYREFIRPYLDLPPVQAEIRRRLPVLQAWRRWYEAREGKELSPEDWANWSWAVSAVYVLRRDGTQGRPEAEELLKAADYAGVGTCEEEKAWARATAEAIVRQAL